MIFLEIGSKQNMSRLDNKQMNDLNIREMSAEFSLPWLVRYSYQDIDRIEYLEW